jgi:hypothetical protein
MDHKIYPSPTKEPQTSAKPLSPNAAAKLETNRYHLSTSVADRTPRVMMIGWYMVIMAVIYFVTVGLIPTMLGAASAADKGFLGALHWSGVAPAILSLIIGTYMIYTKNAAHIRILLIAALVFMIIGICLSAFRLDFIGIALNAYFAWWIYQAYQDV